jgi:hypothetical protein
MKESDVLGIIEAAPRRSRAPDKPVSAIEEETIPAKEVRFGGDARADAARHRHSGQGGQGDPGPQGPQRRA